ncbi:hypothetical protein ACHMW6_06275 [Pseudoduganella sp. UC29_106]|uniref:hypothetical protein n=1 Tax=Pseudoduganella sp. UC29_106 TaxID=3374553 RepID=UPI003757C8E1
MSKLFRKDVVSREIDRKLPQAGRIQISWHWGFFPRYFGKNSWYRFYTSMRGANFGQMSIGPLFLSFPMRWLEDVARYMHPEVFESQPPAARKVHADC